MVRCSVTVTQSELQGKTTIDAAPNSAQAQVYLNLAKKIAGHEISKTPEQAILLFSFSYSQTERKHYGQESNLRYGYPNDI